MRSLPFRAVGDEWTLDDGEPEELRFFVQFAQPPGSSEIEEIGAIFGRALFGKPVADVELRRSSEWCRLDVTVDVEHRDDDDSRHVGYRALDAVDEALVAAHRVHPVALLGRGHPAIAPPIPELAFPNERESQFDVGYERGWYERLTAQQETLRAASLPWLKRSDRPARRASPPEEPRTEAEVDESRRVVIEDRRLVVYRVEGGSRVRGEAVSTAGTSLRAFPARHVILSMAEQQVDVFAIRGMRLAHLSRFSIPLERVGEGPDGLELALENGDAFLLVGLEEAVDGVFAEPDLPSLSPIDRGEIPPADVLSPPALPQKILARLKGAEVSVLSEHRSRQRLIVRVRKGKKAEVVEIDLEGEAPTPLFADPCWGDPPVYWGDDHLLTIRGAKLTLYQHAPSRKLRLVPLDSLGAPAGSTFVVLPGDSYACLLRSDPREVQVLRVEEGKLVPRASLPLERSGGLASLVRSGSRVFVATPFRAWELLGF